MVFVRIKKVKGKEYAYLVENTWNNGKVKQKTIKYLGRAAKHETQKLKDFHPKQPLLSIVRNTLTNAGFIDNKKNNIKVDLEKQRVLQGRTEGAIILNEGILTSHTLKKVLNYVPEEEVRPGVRLAQTLQQAGILVEKDCFIKLYQVLHDT